MPIPLPAPALLCTRRIQFKVGRGLFRRQWMIALWTTRRGPLLKSPATFTRLQICLPGRTDFLLPLARRQLGQCLVPHRKNGRPSTLLTIGIRAIAKPAVAKVVAKSLATVFTTPFGEFSHSASAGWFLFRGHIRIPLNHLTPENRHQYLLRRRPLVR
jgi:hypothetical protein